MAVRDMLTSDPYVILSLGEQVYSFQFLYENHFNWFAILSLITFVTGTNCRKLRLQLKRAI
jgi:hypothetical protein